MHHYSLWDTGCADLQFLRLSIDWKKQYGLFSSYQTAGP
jgi:hypothetical protein